MKPSEKGPCGNFKKKDPEAVRKNPEKFPADFVFELNEKEQEFLRSKISTIKTGRASAENMSQRLSRNKAFDIRQRKNRRGMENTANRNMRETQERMGVPKGLGIKLKEWGIRFIRQGSRTVTYKKVSVPDTALSIGSKPPGILFL